MCFVRPTWQQFPAENEFRTGSRHLTTYESRRYRHITILFASIIFGAPENGRARYAGPEADLRGTSN